MTQVPAILGGARLFHEPVECTPHLPPWNEMQSSLHGIFERRFFTNNGPLVQRLDAMLAERLEVPHAVCVANESIALMMLVEALEMRGEIIVPALMVPRTISTLQFSGLTPVFRDVDPDTGLLEAVEGNAVLGVHLWGARLRAQNTAALLDGTQGMLQPLVLGESPEFVSFNASSVLNGWEGGCILTRDADLALRLKTMRSFAAAETFVPGYQLRTNGKMSEGQAALALLGLEHLGATLAANGEQCAVYARNLAGLRGFNLLRPNPDRSSNNNYVIVRVDERLAGIDRDGLCAALAAENVIAQPCEAFTELAGGSFKNAAALFAQTLRLPSGPGISSARIDAICERIAMIAASSEAIRAAGRAAP